MPVDDVPSSGFVSFSAVTMWARRIVAFVRSMEAGNVASFSSGLPCQVTRAGITLTNRQDGTGLQYSANFIEGKAGQSRTAATHYVPLAVWQKLVSDGSTHSSISDTALDIKSFVGPVALAAVLRVGIKDTGSATTASSLSVYKNGQSSTPDLTALAPHISSTWPWR